MNTILIGLQWGDEGKGKLIDILAQRNDLVVRYQGGNNAGHTVVIDGKTFIFHLIPSGVLHDKKICVIGNGVVVDPEAFLKELEQLKDNSIDYRGRVFISELAHIILPYHRVLDVLREGKTQKIGTTGRGIGPCYIDKFSRCGIRAVDLLNKRIFSQKLKSNLLEKNEILKKIYNHEGFKFEQIYRQYSIFADKLTPFITNTVKLINKAVDNNKKILFEGAQGTFLDVDFGTYPFVTSSSSCVGGACTGTGVAPTKINNVVGVIKAYTTRVGEGPFPTEFKSKLMEEIRGKGNEFGATTGRPRRCGWFDAVMGNYSVTINGVNELAVMKLDVLDELKTIKVCVGYKYKGKIFKDFSADMEVLTQSKPVYQDYPGWLVDTTKALEYADLPAKAKAYLEAIEGLLKTKIAYISVGSKRNQTIFR